MNKFCNSLFIYAAKNLTHLLMDPVFLEIFFFFEY